MDNFIGMGGSEYMVTTSAAYQALKGTNPKAAQLASIAKQMDSLGNVGTLAATLEQNAISFANQFKGRPMTDEDKKVAKGLSDKATAAAAEAKKAKAEADKLQGQFLALNKDLTKSYQVYLSNKAAEDAKKSEEDKRKAQQASAAAQAASERAQATAQANAQNQANQAVNNMNNAVVSICEWPANPNVINQSNLEMCTGYPLPYSQPPNNTLGGKPLGLPWQGYSTTTGNTTAQTSNTIDGKSLGSVASLSNQDIRLANMGSSPEVVKSLKNAAAVIKAKAPPSNNRPDPKAIPPKAPAKLSPAIARRTNPGR